MSQDKTSRTKRHGQNVAGQNVVQKSGTDYVNIGHIEILS